MSTPPSPAKKQAAERARSPGRARPAIELQLAIGKSGVGVELAHAAELGCAVVTELALGLPLAKFPVDVSGGVRRFRHTRGVMERLTVELPSARLAKWIAPRARGLLGESTPHVFVGARSAGATIGLCDDTAGRVLAFEAFAMALDDDLTISIANARGLLLPQPAAALAMRLLASLLGGVAERRGSSFVVPGLSSRVVRALLPEAGARAPDTSEMRIASFVGATDVCILHASRQASPAEASADAVRAREACELLRDADEARFSGDLDRARALDLWALERAPRHPEVCRRIADIDRLHGGRAEAALATLADSDSQAHTGFLAGELATEALQAPRAISALSRAAEAEVVPQLAAAAFARAAELTSDHHDALALLDRAVARGPSSSRIRFARLSRRLEAGRTKDALADAEELEAIAKGARAKHEVWREAGTRWHKAGLARDAGALFERALRYVPDDPDASAGLGATLVAEGKVARGVALLSRAIASQERDPSRGGRVDSRWILALARALAEALGDKPDAIARVRSVTDDEPDAMVARGLEGRWRAALGDLAGAQVAFAGLRELAASRVEGDPSARGEEVKALLLEAAAFERGQRQDLVSAQAHLATALRLRPRDRDLEQAYREICAAIAPPSSSVEAPRTIPPEPADDETRVEQLMHLLRAHPDDDSVVDELADTLSRLGRSHELLALLSARIEEAPPARRELLLPAQIAVLARLEKAARESSHDNEAQLFRDALQALGGVIIP